LAWAVFLTTKVPDADVLFSAHRDKVFRYLCRIVGQGDARELTQEVFLRVARGPVPAADDAGRRAWIFRIARNLALNHVRDDRRRGVAVQLRDTVTPATQEMSAALGEALAQLAATDRDVFLMREAGGLSYQEIAAACEISADAVRSRLHRARQQLRETLGPALRAGQAVSGVRLYDRSERE
jgi:RNA polymerase sigma-70 factor, ECF subfamily